MTPAITLRLEIPGSPRRRVPIRIGEGLSSRLAADLTRAHRGVRLALVADPLIARPLAQPILQALGGRGMITLLFLVPPGERAKTREGKAALEDRLLSAGYGRDSLILALGGGTILDLAGFTAATFGRGIPWIALPTTLLAMVDASIGGKVGINHPRGKNLIGAFHHPAAVYADLRFLASLPDRDYRGGLSEIVKIAAGLSRPLFERLEDCADDLLARRPRVLRKVVSEAIALKARTVRADEREAGQRQVLSFGHTIGHAIEAASGFGIPHGEAVSIGLVVEAGIAVRANGFPEKAAARVERLLARLGLPVALPAGMDGRTVLRFARADKKNRAGLIRYALPVRLGRMDATTGWSRPVADSLVLRAWRQAGLPSSRPPFRK